MKYFFFTHTTWPLHLLIPRNRLAYTVLPKREELIVRALSLSLSAEPNLVILNAKLPAFHLNYVSLPIRRQGGKIQIQFCFFLINSSGRIFTGLKLVVSKTRIAKRLRFVNNYINFFFLSSSRSGRPLAQIGGSQCDFSVESAVVTIK